MAPGRGVRARFGRLRAIKAEGKVTRALMAARCDRGAEIALMLGFADETAEAIRTLDEHWDGGGQPRGLRGEEIPLLGRILCLAQTAEIFHAAGGPQAALDVARRRSGEWFDPALVDAFGRVRDDAGFWDALRRRRPRRLGARERHLAIDDERLDRIADAFAGIIDAKSPWTYRHSDRTCLIVMGVATALGADAAALRDQRRAALLHDIGKLAVSNRILDKPAAPHARGVRADPRAPARHRADPRPRARAASTSRGMASAHHERLDGGGYPHGLADGELTMPMRVLAVADVYEALTSDRPYRRALSSAEALAMMRDDVPGRLDHEAFATLERLLADDAQLAPTASTV